MSQVPSKRSPNAPKRSRNSIGEWLYALWKFSRPHTIVGTTLSAMGIYLLAIGATGMDQPETMATLLLPAWLACLSGNVYIVGLNQLTDVAIDQVNKPHLPVASGEFSPQMGQVIVGVTGVLAIAIALTQGPFLMATIGSSLLIGTAYSLPPIRLKRFPVLASLCIFGVRGIIVNLGLFAHYHQRLLPTAPVIIPSTVWALTAFIVVFTFAIAIFKDIPDAEGDRLYQINTFTLKLGQKAVFNLARWVITLCYGGMAIAALALPSLNAPFVIITHLGLLGLFWWRSTRIDWGEKRSIPRFYQFIWVLFFLEYLLFPLACLMK
jgi:homogentisate phytyltransferase / homogentisate geranylgeranyltransferase